ncbi:MAG: WD40 repeat domain-containing protein [Chthoniobacterales bacterium]|nr:WD40 repeat domain-containing protein [Chthoniobacterales bacterium]
MIVRLRDGGVSLWDAATGTPVTGELPLDKPAEHHVMSTDAKLVLIGFEDGAQVFDGTTGAAVSPLLKARLKNDLQTPALFSPDGETAIIFGGSEAFVWRVRAGQLLARIPTPAREGEEAPPAAFFTRDGAHCFVLDRQGTVTRYDAKSWKQSGKPMRHPAAELAYEFAFAATADGKWLATFDHPGENGPKAHLQLWDATANKPLGKPVVAVNGLSAQFLSTSSRVLITPARGDAHLRELPSSKVAYKTRPHDDVDGPATTVTPDEKWILTWGNDNRLDIYNAKTGELASNYLGSARIAQVMFQPDSSFCYVPLDNTAFPNQHLYDHYLVKLTLPKLDVGSVVRIAEYLHRTSLSPDGRRLLAQQGSTDQERIVLYDTATLNEIQWPAR